MPSSLAALALIIFLSLSTAVSALSIGEIELNSALNQPFSADVPLTATQGDELDSLDVALASQEAFDGYGIDRPEFLRGIIFKVRRTGPKQGVLEMRGNAPVSEPFVTLLVKFTWSAGNLLREYTVLLDPPVFDTSVSAEPVQSASISAPVSAATPAAAPVPVAAPVAAPVAPASSPSAPAPRRAAPAPAVRQPAYSGDSYGPIGNGQSLWGIANRVRSGTDATVNQMMVALYRANPQAFMGNINRMKAGSILRMPETVALAATSAAEANAEVAAQKEEWRTGKPVARSGESASQPAQLKLVAPSSDAAAGDGVVTPGAGNSAVSTNGDVAALRENLKESQRLLAVRDAELQALQQRLADLENKPVEDLLVDEISVDEIAVTDEIIIDVDGDLVDQEIITDEDVLVIEEPAEEPAPESAVTTVTTASSAKDDSVLDTIFGVLANIWLWIGLAVIIVVGLVFFRRRSPAPAMSSLLDDGEESPETREDRGAPVARALPENYEPSPLTQSIVVEDSAAAEMVRKGANADDDLDITNDEIQGLEQTSQGGGTDIAAPDDFDFGLDTIGSDNRDKFLLDLDDEIPLERTTEIDRNAQPDFTKTIGSETIINLDHADPIAEADFHMAYGLYDQAAELLVKALEDEPEDKLMRVKLLEVYFVWENKRGFAEEAKKLRAQIGDSTDAEWNKVLIMGKQICPDDALFEGSSEGVGGAQILDIQLESAGSTESIDFGFVDSGDSDEDLDLDFGLDDASAPDMMDFDIGERESPTMETPTIEAPGADSPTMETPTLQMPAALSGAEDTASINLDDLDIDFDDIDGLLAEDPSADDDSEIAQNSIDSAAGSELADDDATMLAGELDIQSFNPNAEHEIGEDDATMLADSTAISEFMTNETEAADETLQQPRLVDDGDTVEQPGFDELSLEEDSLSFGDDVFDASEAASDNDLDTKLDLARAYIEMSDPDGARSILNEVLEEGGAAEKAEAKRLLEQLD
jgi:pilus assembly protein FimV